VVYASSTSALATGTGLRFDGTNLSVGTSALSGGKFSTLADLTAVNGLVVRDSATTYANNDNYVLLQNSTGATAGGLTHPASQSLGVWGVTDIQFFMGTGATEQMRLTSTGLGIGTSSPLEKLQVNGAILSTGSLSAVRTSAASLDFLSGNTRFISMGADASTKGGFIWYNSTNAAVTEAMRITSAGELILGGTSALLGQSGSLVIEGNNAAPFLSLFRNDTSVSSGNGLGVIRFYGNDTTSNTPTVLATITAEATAAHAAGDNPTALVFGTTPAASATVTERMRLDSAGNLGIGTSSPSTFGTFAVKTSLGSISIASGGSIGARLKFYDSSNTQTAEIINNGGSNELLQLNALSATGAVLFGTNSTERARIDSSGNLLVGTTSVSTYTGNSLAYEPTGSYLVQNHASAKASGAAYTYFQHNGSEIGSITQVDTTSIALNNVSRIKFPATQSASSDANTLDDYEEGTWTPTVIGSGTAGTATYSTQVGRYTKIGNTVYIQMQLTWTGGTGSGAGMYFVGLPFTSASFNAQSLALGQLNDIALTASNVATLIVSASSTTIGIQQYPVGGGSTTAVAYDAAGQIVINGFYFI
jgi:hypothetical protein